MGLPAPFLASTGRDLAGEVPVALTHDGVATAVMMATPADLDDLALGFALTEGLIAGRDDVQEIEIAKHPDGLDVRMWRRPGLVNDRDRERRRRIAGAVGCGLCGVESLSAAARPAQAIRSQSLRMSEADARQALADLRAHQPLHDLTGAAHAAALWRPDCGLSLVREDVGRHNALDKVAGAALRDGRAVAGAAILVTSRVSVEIVQKACALGVEAVLSVSAPTARAVGMAETAGLTLVCNLKSRPRTLSHPFRITPNKSST